MGYDQTKSKLVNILGEQINPASEDTLTNINIGLNTNYTIRIVSSGVYTYIGKAVIGSIVGSAVWQIKRLDETDGNLTILWADGDSEFNNSWSDYISLNYQ